MVLEAGMRLKRLWARYGGANDPCQRLKNLASMVY
jgi:hypothetical protein